MDKQQLYKKIFDRFDVDNSGYLEIKEVSNALHQLGFPLQNNLKVSQKLFEQIDKTQDQKIEFKEFCEFLDQRSHQFEEAYSSITNKSHITASHIRKLLKKIDVEASDEQIRQFLQKIDHNQDGKVTYDDFYLFFALMPYPINAEAIFEKFSKFQFHDDSQGEYTQPIELEQDDEDYYTILKEISSKLLAGGVAGCISRTITAPIDRLKIILQTNLYEQMKLLKVIKQIKAEDGYKGFFKGNGVNCIKIAPETSIKFVMFEQLKKIITDDPQNITVQERFISGGIAGAIAQIVIYPLEITKTRMALAKQNQYAGIFDCMRQIIGQKGYKQLYQGLTPSLIGIFPYAGIDLSVNSLLKEMASSYLEKKQQVPGVGVLLSCGMISSSIGMLCTAPINIIRTRLQSNGLLPEEHQYKGTYDCFKRILKHEGITGFYKGMIPAMMKVLPATSISYTVYGLINQYLNQSDI